MNEGGPCETPLIELARAVPRGLRGEWEIQWAEDGTPTGHSMAPVGKYLHDLADEVERQRVEIVQWRAFAENAMMQYDNMQIELPDHIVDEIQTILGETTKGDNSE